MGHARKLLSGLLVSAVATLAICPLAYASPADDLATAQSQLDSLGSELSTLQDQLATCTSDLEQTQYEISEKQSQIDDTQGQLDTVQTTLASRVSSDYKSGGTSILDILLSSASLEDKISSIYYMQKISQQDEATISQAKDLKQQLSDEQTTLQARQDDQQATLDTTQAKLDTYQEKVSEAQSYYDSLNSQVQAELAAQQTANDNVATAVQAVTTQNATAAAESDTTSGTASADTSGSTSDTTDNAGSGSNISTGSAGGGVATALSCVGCPYVYGASGPSSFDCSGLVCYSYGNGRGRTTYDMIASLKASGDWKTSMSELQYGDLVFPSTGHVGIYIGNGQMVHAPSPGRTVCVANVYSFIGGGSY
ncbi:MAG: NlpC/P60 family protein [Atopobiaceae bacterium]|jgi:cell wall-associated NlpC family hydrolase|nr:NlpC/P60 family protein [Atopobiaceae bacterium]MCI2173224.1 NlpC/P60 family protein [Atopobiaceae bacterium]MCI2207219.1 NlpC/P60 family protein [Atopobiaceae bacterium]